MIRVIVSSEAEKAEVLRRHDFAPLFESVYLVQEYRGSRLANIAGGSLTMVTVSPAGIPGQQAGGGDGTRAVTIRKDSR